MKLVLVVWEDVWVEDGGPWVTAERTQPMKAKLFRQVGFLIRETPEALELTHAIEQPGKGLMAARERIPRGMVRSVTELQPAAPSPLSKRKRTAAKKEATA